MNTKENVKKLRKIILNYIKEYYGESEKNDPCYDIKEMAKYILNKMEGSE